MITVKLLASNFLVLCCVLMLFSHTAYAQSESSCVANEGDTVIYFINGIRTTPQGVDSDRLFLEEALIEKFQDERGLNELPSNLLICQQYNPTKGASSDLAESIEQKFFELENVVVELTDLLADFRSATPAEEQAAQDAFLELAEIQPAGEVVSEFVTDYQSHITSGVNGIILVAHSQGNFFANQAHDDLLPFQQSYVRIVGVATPAIRVADGGGYVTNDEDIIRLVPANLPTNYTLNFYEEFLANVYDFFFKHSFSNIYLNSNLGVRDEVLDLIDKALTDLDFEPDTLSPGTGYVVLNEGDPGIPGDGILVESPVIGLGVWSLAEQISLKQAHTDGLEILFFTEGLQGGINVVEFEFRSDEASCTVLIQAQPSELMAYDDNGVTGLARIYSPNEVNAFFSTTPQNGCNSQVTDPDFYLQRVAIFDNTFEFNSVFTDAIGIRFGELLVVN